MAKIKQEPSDEEKKGIPLYPIGIVAELVGTTDQTLRLYEKHGLITPARRNKNRYYSENDIKWIRCIRELIHSKKISIQGIKKLLEYAPCWELTECETSRRESCSSYIDKTRPCWELNRRICARESGKICEDCVVFISKQQVAHNKMQEAEEAAKNKA
jgi:MerR family transcriptional regulator/heat shock protein HspR